MEKEIRAKIQVSFDFVVFGALAEAARVAVGAYGLIAHAHMRTRRLLIPQAVGALISVLSVWFLSQQFGLLGVGAGLAVAGVASLFAMHFSMKSIMSVRLNGLIILRSLILALGLAGLGLATRNIFTEPVTLLQAMAGSMLSGLLCLACFLLVLWPWLAAARREQKE